MKFQINPIPVALVTVMLMFAGPSLLIAQTSEDTDDLHQIMDELDSTGIQEQAFVLLQQVRASITAIDRYQKFLERASEEDSLVLERQLASSQLLAVKRLVDMANILLDLEKSGSQDEMRTAVEELFMAGIPRIRYRINRLRNEIDEVRALRITAETNRRLQLENRIEILTGFLDQIYLDSKTFFAKMGELDLDISEIRREFEESLMGRADELSGRIELAQERISNLKILQSSRPDDGDVATLLTATKKSLSTNAKSMEIILGIMDAYSLPTAVYRTQLVSMEKDISTILLDIDVAINLFNQFIDSSKNWVSRHGLRLFVRFLLIIGILVLFWIGAKVIRRLVRKALDRSRMRVSRLLKRMIVNFAFNLVMLIGFVVVLTQLGVSLGPLMAGLGVVGFILGFALQDSISNFASGMLILIYRPYDVGDLIDVGGVSGKVDRMSLVSTTIITLDNQTLVIPNNKIWGDVIKNVTAQTMRRVDMVFGVSYSDDIPKAEGVLMEILKSHKLVLSNPAPEVHLHELGDSSVNFVARPWVKTSDYWTVYWDITRAVKLKFDEEQISIPFPQRDIHVKSSSSSNVLKIDKGDTGTSDE
jgi:small conductance mechanosensitive channel